MQDRTHNGVAFRILNIIDEYSRECLMTCFERHLNHLDVLDALNWLFLWHGIPLYPNLTLSQ